MMLFHVQPSEKIFWADKKRSNVFFDGVCNVAGGIYTTAEKVFRTIVYSWLVLTQNSSHTSQKMK